MIKKKLMLSIVSMITMASALNAAQLSNNEIDVRVQPGSPGKISISYFLDKRQHPAVTMDVTLKHNRKLKSYQLKKLSSKECQLVITAAGGQRGTMHVTLGQHNYLSLDGFRNIKKLILHFKSEALLLPDDVSEDTVIYPQLWKQNKVTIPGDFYMAVNMLDHGNALFSCLWNNADLHPIQHKDNNNFFTSMTISPGAKDKILLGLNAAKHIWYKCKKKFTINKKAIAWHPPFQADWKMTMLKGKSRVAPEAGQYDTWPIPVIVGDKIVFGVCSFMNTREQTWYANTGTFIYPIVERDGKVLVSSPQFLHGLLNYNQQFPPIIYPLTAVRKAPKPRILPMDMREKLLSPAVINQLKTIRASNSCYPATCESTEKVEKIFYRNEEKKLKKDIVKQFEAMNKFVVTGRQRIQEYRDFGKKLRRQLDKLSRQQPAIKNLAKSLQQDLRNLDTAYTKQQAKMKTAAHCRRLSDSVINLINSRKTAEKRENECKKICRKIRVIGGTQDRVLAMEQVITKALRQRVTMLLLKNPPSDQRKILELIRLNSGKIMLQKFTMESKSAQRYPWDWQ